MATLIQKCVNMAYTWDQLNHLKSWRHQHSHDTICWCSLAFGRALWCFSYVGKKTASGNIYISMIFLWMYGRGLGNKQNQIFLGCSLHTYMVRKRASGEVIISMLFPLSHGLLEIKFKWQQIPCSCRKAKLCSQTTWRFSHVVHIRKEVSSTSICKVQL